MTELKLSPRDLGPLRLPDFCARCFWITLRCEKKLPFQMGFPGIFMSLDAYGKNLIRAHLETHGRLPKWFPNVGKVTACVPARELHWSRFQLVDDATQILLWRAREIYDQPEPPASRVNCENCGLLENLLSVVA